ncbi:MAG: ADP-glyceromanno-heptose 6-epimerase [Lachnospiraceae bacterium]|nr:ADP-glyceromanno-heptose 6-epimerase [Lachnospiraceae bacterium]
MSIVVTGGAGFIGSCIVRSLNDRGREDIIIVDNIASTDKWMNIRNKRYLRYVHKSDFLKELPHIDGVEAVIHMGACSSTTERDFDYLWKNNFEYSKTLWEYCANARIPFVYTSSAATYGDGSQGFDDREDIDRLLPLNPYGYSKQVFDLWVKHQAVSFPSQYAGLKFFNVYGPDEYCKGSMASMVFHGYRQILETGRIRLFKSYREDIADGDQRRDFVYVKDVCDVVTWLLDHPEISGLFNVGTGRAQSFRELAESVFSALGKQPEIEYIDMPGELREKYQYYTRAGIEKLRDAGYTGNFSDIEKGVADYVQNYLEKGYEVY